MRIQCFPGIVLLLLTPIVSSLDAATTTLVPVADTSISELGGAKFSSNPGTLIAGALSSGEKVRALLRFDPSGIPPNATITSASLRFSVTKSAAFNAAAFRLHRVLSPWTELGATWTSPNGTASWPAGGSFASTEDSTVSVTGTGNYTFNSSAALVATVRSWLANSPTNNGWIMINGDEGTARTARRFAAGDFSTASSRPQLTIDYTLPPAGVIITNAAATNGFIRFQFQTTANTAYSAQFKDSVVATNWTTFTNISATATPATALVIGAITNAQRYFRISTP